MDLRWLCKARLLALIGALLMAGCSDDTGSQDPYASDRGPIDLSQEEEALIVEFVNDAATTEPLLDVDVGLDARAAHNIIIHRDGVDGVYPSGDDNPYDSIAELDSVPYVGPSALEKLRDYLASSSSGAETVEGVEFTADQAAAVIWGVNQATFEELDVEVGLTSTAATNLVASRPYQSVAEIGAVPYVGPSALGALRDYAPIWAAQMGPSGLGGTYDGVTFSDDEAATALEIANTASTEQLSDGGVTTTPRNIIIDNRPWDTLQALADFSGIGPATMQALKDMVSGWTGTQQPPVDVTIAELLAQANALGDQSPYYNQLVRISRGIITSAPQDHAGGSMSFFGADPPLGDVQQLKIYIASQANQDLGFSSLFDDVRVTGVFTEYYSSWEILVDDPALHAISLNRSGVKYEDYLDCQDAWSSTAANPEGAVRVESSFGYIYMVPLPLFKDHPMYDGLPDAGDPDSNYGGNDHPGLLWCGDQQDILDAWLANP